MSLFPVLENEAVGVWWLWATEFEKRTWRKSESKQVMARHQPTFAGSANARHTVYTNTESTAACTKSTFSPKQREGQADENIKFYKLQTGFRATEGKPLSRRSYTRDKSEQSLLHCVFICLSKDGCQGFQWAGSVYICRLGFLYSTSCPPCPQPLLHLPPDLSKITREKQHLDHQLGRIPTSAVDKENQHKFCLNVLHRHPEIHLT